MSRLVRFLKPRGRDEVEVGDLIRIRLIDSNEDLGTFQVEDIFTGGCALAGGHHCCAFDQEYDWEVVS